MFLGLGSLVSQPLWPYLSLLCKHRAQLTSNNTNSHSNTYTLSYTQIQNSHTNTLLNTRRALLTTNVPYRNSKCAPSRTTATCNHPHYPRYLVTQQPCEHLAEANQLLAAVGGLGSYNLLSRGEKVRFSI